MKKTQLNPSSMTDEELLQPLPTEQYSMSLVTWGRLLTTSWNLRIHSILYDLQRPTENRKYTYLEVD